jgi:hypothetical protein
LIDKLEEEDILGLLLLIYFEKAFDTVECPFIEKKIAILWFLTISSKMDTILLL